MRSDFPEPNRLSPLPSPGPTPGPRSGKAENGDDFASLISRAVETARNQETLALAGCDESDEQPQSSEQQLFTALELYNLAHSGSGSRSLRPGMSYPSSMERILSSRIRPMASAPGAFVGGGRIGSESSETGPMRSTREPNSVELPKGGISKHRFIEWLDSHALTRSAHHCAMFVRRALEAAGMSTADRPVDAGDYGPFLLKHGAQVVATDENYRPQPGDTAVFEKTDQHPYGHIEVFNGEQWISDFRQRSFSPYRDVESTPPVTVYRIS